MKLFNKQFFLKLTFLMILSLKMSFAVYQNITHITTTEEVSSVIDLEDSEKEEKKELDEIEKIQQKLNTTVTFSSLKDYKQYSYVLVDYKVLHLQYTTPPPEIG